MSHTKAQLYHTIEHLQQRLSTAVDKQLLLMNRIIEAEERVNEPHLNHHLPPVRCPLLIQVDGKLLHAERTGFVASKGSDMEYELADGRLIMGRYRWTYP